MSAITNINLGSQDYPSPSPLKAPSTPSASSSSSAAPVDQTDIVDISHISLGQVSETGRIALNVKAGNLTSDQSTQLYQQVASIQSQITADKQANGGKLTQQDAQAIRQLQNQLSTTIYSDAHGGATPPPNTTPAEAGKREGLQAGRIVLNAQAGKLTTSQAQQLAAQQAQIDQLIATDKQANGGTLTQQEAQQINQMQNQAGKQIYDATHVTPGG